MAAFGRSTFSHVNYALSRPTYPAKLYKQVLDFHKGPRKLALDLGTGHGLVARNLAPHFEMVTATDPSPGMLEQARQSTPKDQYHNVSFQQASAESLPFLDDSTVDLVIAAQAAHWFDYPRLWPELQRVVRRNGTVAFWGYGVPVFVDFAPATRVLRQFAYGNGWDELGSHWQQPGAGIVQNRLRELPVPEEHWAIERRVYEPDRTGQGKHKGDGDCLMETSTTLGDIAGLMRSWSSYYNWKATYSSYKARKDGGEGDCVDWCVDRIAKAEGEAWKDGRFEVDIECATGLILAWKR